MSQIQDIETAVIARLRAQLPGVPVMPFANNPLAHKNLQGPALALVSYRGSKLGHPSKGEQLVQERKLYFQVAILASALRDKPVDTYAMMDGVYAALLGFEPAGCDAIWIERDEFDDQREGVWQYVVLFATQTWAVQPDDETPPAKAVELFVGLYPETGPGNEADYWKPGDALPAGWGESP